MEEEKVEVNDKKINLKEFNYKKYLPYAGIAVAVVAVIIILVVLLGGGPKKAVKAYISGINKQNPSKVLKSMDLIGASAWGYSYDEKDFSKEDYEEFTKDYKEAKEEMDKEDLKEGEEYFEEALEESFDDIEDEYKSYKIKIDKFKSKEKLGKDLYAVKVKISLEAKPKDKEETEEIDESATTTFIVYKGKVISSGDLDI